MASKFVVGDKVRLSGRFQSRRYYKHTDAGEEEHTVYEVSVTEISLDKTPDEEDGKAIA